MNGAEDGGQATGENRPAAARAFGSAVRALRRRAGLSLNELARRAGVDPAYVHRIESTTTARPTLPRRGVVLGLARALELDRVLLDDLLTRAGLCPETVLEIGGWDRALADVADVLVDPSVDAVAKAELRDVIHVLAGRWRAGGKAAGGDAVRGGEALPGEATEPQT